MSLSKPEHPLFAVPSSPGSDQATEPGLVRVVVAHPGALVRIGLAELLRRVPNASLLASVASGNEAAAAIRENRPELAIIAPQYRRAVVSTPCPPRLMLVSPHDHCGDANGCTHSCAFSSERTELDSLLATLQRILACAGLRDSRRPCLKCPLRASLAPGQLPLSPREQQVFELIADGQITGQIALSLGVGIKTVETYRANIKHKLSLGSSMALTEAAVLWRRGIHPLPRRA